MQTEFSKNDSQLINNDYYHDLGMKWYEADDDPIALLRAEARVRTPWIIEQIHHFFPRSNLVSATRPIQILDIGCGAGFLSNALAGEGFSVSGIDLSESSLAVAKAKDQTGTVKYLKADAYELPFADSSLDVVTSTDFLEHVSEPRRVLQEVTRVLKPGGYFFYHTFNKNLLSRLLVIKAMEWFVKNTPEDLHVYDLFINPKQLQTWLLDLGITPIEIRGLRPVIFQTPILKLIFKGIVDPKFRFVWTESLAVSYVGIARKNEKRISE